MSRTTKKGRIIGTGSCAPNRVLTNDDLERIVETNDEWIVRRSGIRERRVSMNGNGESTAALGGKAARRAMDMAGVTAQDLDMIVVGTVTPDRQFPSAGCMIESELGASCPAFDVSAGCSGFMYALNVANNCIGAGRNSTILVVGVERLSTVLNWRDRSTCVLLGDGAGAVVLTDANGDPGIFSIHLQADGGAWDLLYSDYYEPYVPDILEGIETKPFNVVMDGNKLFKKAVNCLASISRQALEHNSLTPDDIDLVVPHQANIRIIQSMSKNLGIPMERVYTNVGHYGNTSSASIPLALDEANRNGRLKKGDRVLLATFGAGLTWGATLLEWNPAVH